MKRVIQDRHVARREAQVPAAGFDGEWHGPEMDRDMRGLRHQLSGLIEHGAGKITALLDVRGKRRALQKHPHFLGHRTVQMFKDFPFNGFLHEPLLW